MKKNIFLIILLSSLSLSSAYSSVSSENRYPSTKLEQNFGDGYSIKINNFSDSKLAHSAQHLLGHKNKKLNKVKQDYIITAINQFFDKIKVNITKNAKNCIESDWYYPIEENNVSFKFYISNLEDRVKNDFTSLHVDVEQRNKVQGRWSAPVKNYNLSQQVKEELIESARILYMFEK